VIGVVAVHLGLWFMARHYTLVWLALSALLYFKAPWHKFAVADDARSASSDQVRAKGPLSIHEADGWTVIHAQSTRAGSRFMTFFAWLFAAMFAVPIYFIYNIFYAGGTFDSHDPMPGIVAFVAFGFLFSTGFGDKLKKGKGIQAGSFAVSAQKGIRLPSGQTIPLAQVYAINVRNTSKHRIVPVNVLSSTAVAGNIIGYGISSKIKDHSYAVEVEHSGVATIVAGGLTESLAHAVQTEITRRLPGFKR
jgi:hypothetical protein